jgi:hypothetical protein
MPLKTVKMLIKLIPIPEIENGNIEIDVGGHNYGKETWTK